MLKQDLPRCARSVTAPSPSPEMRSGRFRGRGLASLAAWWGWGWLSERRGREPRGAALGSPGHARGRTVGRAGASRAYDVGGSDAHGYRARDRVWRGSWTDRRSGSDVPLLSRSHPVWVS